ncbi:hypothetical protein GCM10027098_20130 [Bowmanella dokdonensis]
MYEYIFAVVFRSNETETFIFVKPLNGTDSLRHECLQYKILPTARMRITPANWIIKATYKQRLQDKNGKVDVAKKLRAENCCINNGLTLQAEAYSNSICTFVQD